MIRFKTMSVKLIVITRTHHRTGSPTIREKAYEAHHLQQTPTAMPISVPKRYRNGCCHASCGLNRATTKTTAIVIPVVTMWSSRLKCIITIAPKPIATAMPKPVTGKIKDREGTQRS
jgi:hypothetical protein